MKYVNIKIQILGNGWFDRYLREHPQVLIPTSKEANSYRVAKMDLKVWSLQRHIYMFHNNYGEITVESDMHCFLVEKSEVSV